VISAEVHGKGCLPNTVVAQLDPAALRDLADRCITRTVGEGDSLFTGANYEL
jgi:hypothetical protein